MYMQRRSMFDVQDVVIPQVFGNTVVPQRPVPEAVVDDEDDMEEDIEEENDDIQEHEIQTESTSVEEEGSTDTEEMELLKLGKELEEELDEIVKLVTQRRTTSDTSKRWKI